MTDEEKKLKELLHTASRRLRATDFDALPSHTTDPRISRYLSGLSTAPTAHNVYELLSAVRFVDFFDRYIWRGDKVRHFFDYFEKLKFPGDAGRQCYPLTPIQAFQFAALLGFYEPSGGRLTREAILFLPRKFSKTTSLASLASYDLFFGDANAQSYVGANSYPQAQICFREIRELVRQFDPRSKLFKLNREHLEWRKPNDFGKESFVECLTGNADTKDGLNASFVIMDEYAASSYVRGRSEGAELLNVLRSSMGTRKNPMVVIITTAGRNPNSPFMSELEHAKAVLRGEREDDGLFAHLFLPDPWDTDISSPALWRKCNPHIGITIRDDFYEKQWKGAQHDIEKLTEFKTKLLNIFVNHTARPWFSRQEIDVMMTDFSLDHISGRPPAIAAFDLSVSGDFSCVTYNIYNRREKKFYLFTDYYIPEEAVAEHPNRAQYEVWIEQGYLKTCPGKVIDHVTILNDFIARGRRLKIMRIGYDAYKSLDLVNGLRSVIGKKSDKIIKAVSQTYGSFNAGVEMFELAAKRNPTGIAIHSNPINAYCLANACVDTDKLENKKPIKRSENLKIDSVITSIMTFILIGLGSPR